jgi:hypothetical protein
LAHNKSPNYLFLRPDCKLWWIDINNYSESFHEFYGYSNTMARCS